MAGKGRKAYWDERREKFAQALAANFSAEDAGRLVGYSAANARRNAQRPDVKARVAELKAPALAKVQAHIDVSTEAQLRSLHAIAFANVDLDSVKPAEAVSAHKLIAQMQGNLAPEKREHSGEIKVQRIERVIVDPADSHGKSVQTAAGARPL